MLEGGEGDKGLAFIHLTSTSITSLQDITHLEIIKVWFQPLVDKSCVLLLWVDKARFVGVVESGKIAGEGPWAGLLGG